MSQPYKSGRQQNLNLGISSVTENKTVLQTIGKVGIGTTNAQNHSLFVVGTTNITGDINVGGASTFVGVGTFRNDLYVQNQLYVGGVSITGGATVGADIVTRNLKATGISTFVGITTVESTLFTKQLSVSGVTTFGSNAYFGDTDVLNFGDGNDLQIYHDGANSVVKDIGTGSLILQSDGVGVDIYNIVQGEYQARFKNNGPVELYYDNIKRLETTGYGVSVYDTIQASQLNVTGVGTIKNFVVPSGGEFNVYDTTATFHNNLYVAGNLSIGGTSTIITAQDLRVYDKDIVLGIATDAFGNDVTTDITANHGGIAIASTEGSPLVSLSAPGITTLPDTYKQLMWIKSNTFGVGTTDAWMFNYAVGIGSTQVPNGVRFAVNGIQFTDTTISAPNLNLSSNLNVAGITTLAANGGITTTGGDLFVGGDLYIKDDLFFDEFTARNANITGLTTVGVVSATSVNATGIITASSFRPSSGFYQSANGTNAFFVYNGTGNVAFQGTIGVGQINSGQGYQAITLSSDSIPTVTFVDNGRFVGVVTARQFVGDINAGVATITQGNITNASGTTLNYTGISTLGVTGVTNLTTQQLNVSGLSTFAGITTHTATVFGTDLSLTGIATINKLDVNQISPNGIDFGGAQYLLRANGDGTWGWADVPGIFSVNNILNGFNVSDEGLIVGTAGSITQLDFRGNNIIATADPQPNGIATIRVSDNPDFLTLNVSGLSTFAGITTVTGATLFTKQLNVAGVSTFVGVSTFINDLFVGGNLFVQNDLVFDEFTARNATITGFSTLGIASATSLFISGISTFAGITTVTGATLFAKQLNVAGVSTFQSTLFGSQANFTGIVTAGTINANIGIVTTFTSTNASLTNIDSVGISTLSTAGITNLTAQQLNVSGISTFVGITTSQSTIFANQISVAGISTFAGITTHTTSLFGTQASFTGIVTANTFVGQINAGVGTITTLTSTSSNLTNINSTGISTFNTASVTNLSAQQLNVTGLSTFVGFSTFQNNVSIAGTLDVNGNINFNGSLFQNNSPFVASRWTATSTGGNIYRLSSVGIGTSTLTADLTVRGNAHISGITSVTNLEIYGTVSAGTTTGTNGQYLRSTGVGVTWSDFPTLRTTGISTATEGQTTFSFSYNVGFVDVFINGVKLTGSEFTASNGSSIVLQSPAYENDIVEFIGYNTVSTSGGGGSGASSLNDLTDVTLTSPAAGEAFVYDGTQWVNDYTVTASTSTTSQTVIHTLSSATYRSVEYTIQATQGLKYHLTKILAVHDGLLAYPTEYGTVYTIDSLGTFDIDVSSGNIRLLVTPSAVTTTDYKIKFTAFKV